MISRRELPWNSDLAEHNVGICPVGLKRATALLVTFELSAEIFRRGSASTRIKVYLEKVGGEHRLEAEKANGRTHIAALITEVSEEEARDLEMATNIVRAAVTRAEMDAEMKRKDQARKALIHAQGWDVTKAAPLNSTHVGYYSG
jgi:hypothetical protein